MAHRILHVIGSAQIEATGIARIIADIATSLDPREYLSEVIFLDRTGPLRISFEKLGIPVHCIRWRHPYRDPLGYLSFRRFLKNNHYDLVHFHWGGARLQKLAHIRSKVVVHLHGRINESTGAPNSTLSTANADALIAVCAAVARQSRHPRTRVIYPGVPPLRRTPLPGSAPTLGFAGRLVRLKGAHVLLQSLRLLLAEFPALRLEVAGSGVELQNLQKLAKSLRVDHAVTFLGWQEDVAQRFSSWQLFIQPSLEEGIPTGLLHAMSAGMPVIATLVGGVPEVIEDGVTGRLVPPGNPLALAGAVRALLISPEKRGAMGEAAAQAVKQRFSAERMASQTADLYSELLNARS